MKHKRMAVLFVLVTFAGTPPVWQKLNNFISAVQRRAQVKFLSMVLSTGSEEVETLRVPSPINVNVASCPGSTAGKTSNMLAGRPRSGAQRTRAERLDSIAVEESRAVAMKQAAMDGKLDSLAQFVSLLPETPNRLTMHAIAAVPRELLSDGNAPLEFVVVPSKDLQAPGFIESWNSSLKVRKVVEVNKAGRPRTRYVIGRPLYAPAASKGDAASSEREG